jgi:beta-galactosidase
MPERFPPVAPSFPHLLHGGDYNPEQWIATPEVWDEDLRLMKLAGCNTVSVGIFSWAMLEPEIDRFDFSWLDRVMDKLAGAGIRVNLATPGGAKPAWLAEKFPQALRVTPDRRRMLWGGRHNHCFTARAFRERAQVINGKLAERYGTHPTLTMWHVNNEYSGDCHCDLCQDAFRAFLRARYHDDLDALNHAWWNTFWSHTLSDWSQIQSPSPIGERNVHGLNLDWKRFTTHQTIDCFRDECAPLRRITPTIPITTNLMGGYAGLNYYELAKACDVVSWDSYPAYHDRPNDWEGAAWVSFIHAQRRAMRQKPFILMECAPAQQNYKAVCKVKRPGVHKLEALQAIAHGSDSVLYFQWRKSRGSTEKFHGAVVDHHATEHNRVFREVADVGQILGKLDGVVGADSPAEVAVVYDYENRWAIDDTRGPHNKDRDYAAVCTEHYRAFWSAGVNADVIDSIDDFSRYKLLVAPMLYMLRPGVAERIVRFVEAGGVFVTTFFSGVADESDLCFLNGFPGPLRKLMGVWAEELDALYDDERVPVVAAEGNAAGLSGSYDGRYLCDIVHPEGAEVLATYGGEFYAGTPAVTVNRVGQGRAYYLATRTDRRFADDFYGLLIDDLKIERATATRTLPLGVAATTRVAGNETFVFLMSFVRDAHDIDLGNGTYRDAASDEAVSTPLTLPGYGVRVLVTRREEQ